MLSRFSCLGCVLTNASKFVTTRKSFPVPNLLLHTANVNWNWIKTPPLPLNPPTRPKVAVLLNGCGGSDGSNVCETVCLFNQLKVVGLEAEFFASSRFNLEGENSHRTGSRNFRIEAARLTLRRTVNGSKKLKKSDDCRALIIPGSQYYTNHIKCKFESCQPPLKGDPFIDEIFKAIGRFHRAGKPIGTISSAGLLVAGKLPGVKFTMGEESTLKSFILTLSGKETRFTAYENPHARRAFGLAKDWNAQHENRIPEETSHCTVNNVYSTPGSMSQTHTYDKIHIGIAKLVYEISEDINKIKSS